MYYVYILFNTATGKYYVGFTECVNKRLGQHKAGQNTSTKYKCKHRNLVYVEVYINRQDAEIREKKLKAHGSGLAEIKKRISNTIRLLKSKTGAGER